MIVTIGGMIIKVIYGVNVKFVNVLLYIMARGIGLKMSAREMFEKLGYKQKIYNYKGQKKYSNGIQYLKIEDETDRTGFITKHVIEFYFNHQEIECLYILNHKSSKDTIYPMSLHYKEIKAIQQQIKELGWEK